MGCVPARSASRNRVPGPPTGSNSRHRSGGRTARPHSTSSHRRRPQARRVPADHRQPAGLDRLPVASYPTATRRILLWLLCGVLSLSPSTLVASHIWPSGAGSTVRSLPYVPLKNVWKFVSELPLITAR